MIVYANKNLKFDSTRYDAVYEADRKHFTHSQTFDALETIFAEDLNLNEPFFSLDLGCGQGQVAAKICDLLAKHNPSLLDEARIYGLDLSPVAIRQCEESYPDLYWINDTLQGFLGRNDTKQELFGRFNLVVNKGGLTFIESEEEYDSMLEGINNLLCEGGIYVYIQNKNFYTKWSNETCLGWKRDVFDIAGENIGPPGIIDNKGYFIYCYRKLPKEIVNSFRPRAEDSIEIEFKLSNNKIERWFVGGDIAIASRIKFLAGTSESVEVFRFDVPNTSNPQVRAQHIELANATANRINADTCAIIVPTHLYLRPDGGRSKLTPGLYGLMEGQGICPLHYPTDCISSRHYCSAINDWVVANASYLLLGFGLEDYRRDADTMTAFIDIDEFTTRLKWLLRKLEDESQTQLVWIWLKLDRDITSADGKKIYRSCDAQAYQQAALPILREHNAILNEIEFSKLLMMGRFNHTHAINHFNKVLRKTLKAESAVR